MLIYGDGSSVFMVDRHQFIRRSLSVLQIVGGKIYVLKMSVSDCSTCTL